MSDACIGSAGGFAVIHSGYLIKSPPLRCIAQPTFSRWRKRYFILRKNKRFEYWADARQRELRGCVDLREVWQIVEDVQHRGRPTFCLTTNDRKYFFVAESPAEKREWIAKLRSVIGTNTKKPNTASRTEGEVEPVPAETKPRSQSQEERRRLVLRAQETIGSVDFDSDEGEEEQDSFHMCLNPLREAATEAEKSGQPKAEFEATYNDDPVLLRIEYPNLEMCNPETKRMMQYWPITALRGYSQDGDCFQLEAGRRCPGGEGFFQFTLKSGGNVCSSLAAIESKNAVRRDSLYGTVGRK